jgi:hypothetical protein
MFMSSKRNLVRENEELKAQIAALTQQGQASPRQGWGLGLENGKNHLDQERLDLEKARLAEEKYRFEAQAARTYAGQVVQALLLLNGAAALAMLTFIGNVSKDTNLKSLLLGLSNPLSCFADGAALAVLSAIFAYLSQASWADGSSLWGNTLRLFAIVLALGSLLLFVGGISQANAVFASFH